MFTVWTLGMGDKLTFLEKFSSVGDFFAQAIFGLGGLDIGIILREDLNAARFSDFL